MWRHRSTMNVLAVVFICGVICLVADRVVDRDRQVLHSLQNNLTHSSVNRGDSLFGNCDEAKPVILLEGLSDYDGNLNNLFSRNDTAFNFSEPIITGPGWLNLMIVDILIPFNPEVPYPCYRGHYIYYSSLKCANELQVSPRAQAYFNGSNGYDLRVVQDGAESILWAPILDHLNGTYSAKVRVPDTGGYTIEVHRNDRNGCHLTDCDNPHCKTFYNKNRQGYCDNVPSPCVSLVATRRVLISPVAKATPVEQSLPPLPKCPQHNTASGRWVKPSQLIASNSTDIFGTPDSRLVWQPYDCSLTWMPPASIQSCLQNKELIFIGLSRERTNFFDVMDLQSQRVNYRKHQHSDQVDNLHYFSIYFSQLKDMKTWNQRDDNMTNTRHSIKVEVGEETLVCHRNYTETTGRTVHIYLTVDALMIIEHAKMERWDFMIRTYFEEVTAACPNAVLHYGTTVAFRSQFGSLSSQRMRIFNEMGLSIARSLGIPTIDAFSMTQPLIMEKDVFPDSVHLFSHIHLAGNYVSKTITMLMLNQACSIENDLQNTTRDVLS